MKTNNNFRRTDEGQGPEQFASTVALTGETPPRLGLVISLEVAAALKELLTDADGLSTVAANNALKVGNGDFLGLADHVEEVARIATLLPSWADLNSGG